MLVNKQIHTHAIVPDEKDELALTAVREGEPTDLNGHTENAAPVSRIGAQTLFPPAVKTDDCVISGE